MTDLRQPTSGRPVAKFVLRGRQETPERVEVPISLEATDQLLVESDGRPIWPGHDAEDREALTAITKVFGAAIVPVKKGKPVRHHSPPAGREIVLGIGNVENEARLYAHLTGRTHEVRSEFPEALSDDVAIIVCHGVAVRPELVELLSLHGYRARAPGVIWGRSRRELRNQVLVASCAAALCSPAPPPFSVVGPRMGGRASVPEKLQQLREGLAGGSGVLTIYGHSDGIAQDLSAGAAMCTRGEPGAQGDSVRAPECVYTGQCSRLGMPVKEAIGTRRLVSPTEIAARIVLDIGCQAVFVGNQALDPAWSGFPLLNANTRIGAVIAPAHVFRLSGRMGEDLVSTLEEGIPIGEALARYDAMPSSQDVHERLLLFGDPRIRSTSSAAPPRLVAARSPSPPSVRIDGPIPGSGAPSTCDASFELDFIRSVSKISRPETLPKCRENAQRLLDYILAIDDPAKDREANLIGLRKAVLRQLHLTRARLGDVWIHEAVDLRDDQVIRCPMCGARSPTSLVQLSTGMTRETFTCFACTEVFDFQAGTHNRPNIRLPFVSLHDPQCDAGWAGTIVMVRKNIRKNTAIDWPREADGTPSLRFGIDSSLEPGPVHIHAIFMSGLSMNAACTIVAGGVDAFQGTEEHSE